MKKMPCAVALVAAISGACAAVCADEIAPICQFDVSHVTCGWRSANENLSVEGNPLKIGGRVFDAGLGVHAPSRGEFDLEGACSLFEATVGVDDESFGTVEFKVWGDGKLLWESGVMSARAQPRTKDAKVDVSGVESLVLEVADAGDGRDGDHADWADARLVYPAGHLASGTARQLGILTPPERPEPRINGPSVYGVRPGHPVIYHVPVTGEEPIEVEVMAVDGQRMQESGPLSGLRFDGISRVISGRVDEPGEYRLAFCAKNARGNVERPFTLKVGEAICLTPVMGWSGGNALGDEVSMSMVIAAANALTTSGLARHGWNTLVIDDHWARKGGKAILPNKNFPNMKKLTAYLHGRGFKAGIGSSPGELTAGGCAGSWMRELQDAKTFADWEFDYLVYDLGDYGKAAGTSGQQAAMHPYLLMGKALRDQKRDFVFAISQRGANNVATWGACARGHSWRTSGRDPDRWSSVVSAISRQKSLWHFSAPGAFNDPGTLRVGPMRRNGAGGQPLTPNEQYSQMSMWALMAAPLMIGFDIEKMDDFTRSLLSNDEVIDIDQDELGKAAACVAAGKKWEAWARPLADGSIAVGLLNRGMGEIEVPLHLSALGLEGKWRVRDCWRQKDEGVFAERYAHPVPPHATHLVRLFPQKGARCRLRDVRENDWLGVVSAEGVAAARHEPAGEAKTAGFAMRLDDNHSPAQWRDVAAIFESQGMRASFAVISGKLSDEQGRCLADLAARGHEIMDHTPQHAMFKIVYPDDRMFAAAKDSPWAAETDPANRTIYCRPELDFSHRSAFRFRGAIRGGELVGVEPALAKRLLFSRKFFDISTGRGYGISKIEGDRRFVLDFWRRPVKEDVTEGEFVCIDQAAITTPKDLRRAQAALTRHHFDRFGIPRPTMWIQPGGWEAFLDWRRLKEVYGDEFGYIGGDAVVGGSNWNGCFCDPEPVRGRWSFKPKFGYFDESVPLAQVKRQVADSIALGRSFIYISHMNARRLAGGWDEWLRSTRAFVAWLRAAKIPVMTVTRLNRHVFDGEFSAANVFPSFCTDRDGDGNPDGVKLEDGARCDVAAGTVRLGKGQRVQVEGFCGLARGANVLSFVAVGAPRAKVCVKFRQMARGGQMEQVVKSFTLGDDGRCVCRLPVAVKPASIGAFAVFTADSDVTLSEPTFGPEAK